MRGHSGQPSGGDRESPSADVGEQFFEGMVAAASDAVLTVDADGTVVYANPAVADLLGYDPATLRGRPVEAVAPERHRDRYREWFVGRARAEGGARPDGARSAGERPPDEMATDGERPPADETATADADREMTVLTADGSEKRVAVSGAAHGSDGRSLFTAFLREAPDGDESSDRDGSGARRREEDGALIEEIFDTSPIALAVRDADGELLRANERATEQLGVGADRLPYDATDADDDAGESRVYDADGERLSKDEMPVGRVVETGEPVYNEEFVVERPSGRRVHLSVSATPVETDGEVERVVTAAEDVTELKESQHALERRREELETELSEVFTRIADAFFALDDDWNVTYVNEEAGELLRLDESEIVGDSIWDVFSEAVGTTFQREYERAMETQEPVSFVEYYPPLSTWFEVRAYPSESGLSVYFRDVTERRARQQQLERYETIVETTDDGIYILDDEMQFTMANSALADMLGYAREDLLGRSVWEVVDDREELRSDVDELIEEQVAGDRTSTTVEVDVLTADGETFPAEARFVTRPTDGGREHIGVVRDVTDQKRRETELRDRIDQQEAVSKFSRHALEDRPLDDLMDEAAELVAETLDQEYGKVLELRRDADDLLLRAGYGWDDDVVGEVAFDTERGSQAGYTLLSAEPVVVEDFESEDRFAYPDLKAERGMISGVSSIIGSPADPWGIIETHATERREYADYEVQFVQSIAHILYTAVRRRRRQHQLEQYETIVETVEDGVYALDPDERFVMVNDSLCELTGWDREELLGEHASAVHSDEINERAAEMSESVADDLGSAAIEFDLRTKDGGIVPVETRFGPYRYDDESVARTGVVRDVTERKRFEQTLTALHESSRELLGLETADAVAESVLRTTTDVLGISGAGIYLYDGEAEALEPAAVSDHVADIFGEMPTFGPGDDAITWRAFADGETVAYDDVAETDAPYRDDTPLRSGVWIPLGDHGVLAVVSEAVDAFGAREQELADLLAATAEAALDRVEREQERREHERRLEAQNERLDAFASMLAHELRNPLEIAQIYLDMGVTAAVDEDDDGSAFEEVERALDRIEEMIETLLVVTRRGASVDGTEVVDLGEKAREWWDDLDPDGSLVVETDRRLRTDPSRLRQLLENLYRNSAEHGGPGVTVRIGDLEGGFYVEDDGPGIPEDEREEVFEPGYSTSNVGIGFGLAVVEQLVRAHGWDCEITESESGGARFEFTDVDVVEE
ncbi:MULTISPECIES: PAS domain S-box protein [Halorussus]|uniref:PAS domain S-box protein n=1 Tax=Halorussus TaxID=1070314 RepID=UPI000E211ED6|nr:MULTISPECIES: PAS domain S-box protein [Halorussus]NHN61093.1 PAS domain S-box protein [Halorussus sp. JP-T4]